MCSLTIAPPSSTDYPHGSSSSWGARVTKLRIQRPPDARTLPLSFRDLQVTARDVTTVGEAFARCSSEGLLAAVMRHEAGWRIPVDAVGSRAHHMLMGKIASALETMRSLEGAVATLSPSREGMVGPLFRFAPAEGGVGLEHRVEAAVLLMEDAPILEGFLERGIERACTWDALRNLRCAPGADAIPERLAPEAFSASHTLLARMPWERVLALPLWLPSDLSEAERQAILARVFWSMTYHGFTQGGSQPGVTDVPLEQAEFGGLRTEFAPWPTDPVLAVLDHNCWVDTLEAWNAIFALISPSETRL